MVTLRFLTTRANIAVATLFGAAAAGTLIAAPPLPTLVETAAESAVANPFPLGGLKLAARPTRSAFRDTEEPNGQQLSDGVWVHRDSSGRALASGSYQGGQRQGLWVRHFMPGEGAMFLAESFLDFEPPFTSEAEFKQGKLCGKCQIYDAQRRVAAEWQLCNDVVDGEVVWYFASGVMRQQSTFRQGFLDGEQMRWNARGEVIDRSQQANGLQLTPYQETYRANVIRCTGWHVDTSKRFAADFNWWQGIADIVAFEGAPGQVKHGQWTWRYESGQEQLQGTYDEGRAKGTFIWWHENGQRQLAGEYLEGEPSGEFIWWHANGQKQRKVTYVEGRPSGDRICWDASGTVVEKSDLTIDPLEDVLSTGAVTNVPAPHGNRAASRLVKKFIAGDTGRSR